MDYPIPVQRIAHLLDDPEITEIMINGPRQIFVERAGTMQEVPTVFGSTQQLEAMVDALIVPTGRSVNTMSPFADFRLADGSRVNVVIHPIALSGPIVTIRKFTRTLTTMADLVRIGTLSERMAYFFYGAIRAKLNMIFSGGTGTGKTTTLGLASGYLPDRERIVVIEDTAELELRQRHTVRLECRPPNMEGTGAVHMRDLLKNSLRMRPTRLIVGEVRGEEAIEMLQAMQSGHDGVLAVIHASSPSHAVSRLEMMVLSRGYAVPLWGIQRQISDALDVVVHMEMLPDGTRKCTHITEVGGVDDGEVVLRDIYRYDRDANEGRGAFLCSGVRPAFAKRIGRVDANLEESLFVEGVI